MSQNGLFLALFLFLSACTPRTEPPAPYTHGEEELNLSQGKMIIVNEGETVRSLAKKYRISAKALIRLNSLKYPYRLYPGQRLGLPPKRLKKTKKLLKPSQTLKKEPSFLQSSKKEEKERNSLGAKSLLKVKSLKESISEKQKQASVEKRDLGTEKEGKKKDQPKNTEISPQASKVHKFIWPVKGTILKSFELDKKKGINNGINIAVPEGTPVLATQEGEVAYAGSQIKGFGQLVLVRHAEGWMSSYAHNQKILVKRGDKVAKGRTIAFSGSTGNVSVPQVHFELRKNTQVVDPRAYLE